MTARERLRLPLSVYMQFVDPDLTALWILSLLGNSEDLVLEYLERWPADYRAAARA